MDSSIVISKLAGLLLSTTGIFALHSAYRMNKSNVWSIIGLVCVGIILLLIGLGNLFSQMMTNISNYSEISEIWKDWMPDPMRPRDPQVIDQNNTGPVAAFDPRTQSFIGNYDKASSGSLAANASLIGFSSQQDSTQAYVEGTPAIPANIMMAN